MVLNRRRRLPAVPPDPGAARTAQERQALQTALDLQKVIDNKVLPRVNRLLGSGQSGSYAVAPFSIRGSVSGVRIGGPFDTLDWVRLLLASLQGPAYRGYTVTAVAEWRESPSRPHARRLSIPLNESDPRSTIREAEQQGGRKVQVGVYVRPTR